MQAYHIQVKTKELHKQIPTLLDVSSIRLYFNCPLGHRSLFYLCVDGRRINATDFETIPLFKDALHLEKAAMSRGNGTFGDYNTCAVHRFTSKSMVGITHTHVSHRRIPMYKDKIQPVRLTNNGSIFHTVSLKKL